MSEHKLSRFSWFIAIAAGLGGSSLACSKDEPPASPASVGQAQMFRFAPADGMEYVRTDRRSEAVAIVGMPLRRVDNEELRWRIRIDREGDEYRVKQDLVYISFARDGQTLAQGEVPEGISAKLVIDNQGNLKRVEGLERTAEILQSAFAKGKETEAKQVITADSLARIVAARYKLLFGDTIGRPAAPGSTWTITNPSGSSVKSRTVTVTGHEDCGATTCAKLQVDFQLDPQVIADTAVSMVTPTGAPGEDASKITVRNASYHMTGWMLVEPATMLSHGASLTETGTVTVADAKQQELTVEMKGTTELSYSYDAERTSEQPSLEPRTDAHSGLGGDGRHLIDGRIRVSEHEPVTSQR